MYTTQAVVLHQQGPYGDCLPGYTIGGSSNKLVYDCWTENSYGNTWTHLTAYYSNQVYEGWIWDAKLPNGGSSMKCDW